MSGTRQRSPRTRRCWSACDADLQRAKDLVTSQAGTQQAYDQALAAQKAAQANLPADQATLDADKVQLGYATITAPISGRLGAVNVTVGDLVGNNTGNNVAAALVTVTQIDPLRVSFNLPESDLALLQKALASPQAANVTLRKDGDPTADRQGHARFRRFQRRHGFGDHRRQGERAEPRADACGRASTSTSFWMPA